jgi:pyruvate ferredoxin oxidoreductase beta subunit
MIMNLKEYAVREKNFYSGHRSCAGCGMPIVARTVLSVASDYNVVVSNATGCMEVTTTIYPESSWGVPWIHNTFENAAATISGVESAYKALKRKGKIKKPYKFIAFGGDGGTYDIGLQSLSGALERGHDFLYVCYDNEGYMNTGGQRSSATPYGASTTTSPSGRVHKGKEQWKKDLARISAAHHIPYVAQASIANWADFIKKVKKGLETEGPSVLVVLSPCILLWHLKPDQVRDVSQLAIDTCFWPLYEIVDGKYILNYDPGKRKKPIEEFMKPQGRYKHLFKPKKNKEIIKRVQDKIDADWQTLKRQADFDKQNS